MKDPLILLQVLCILFLNRFDTTESRYLETTTSWNLPEEYSLSLGDGSETTTSRNLPEEYSLSPDDGSETTTSRALPEGYSLSPGDNAAYKLYTDEKPWAEARDRCISDGGHLAIADSRKKIDHILSRIPRVMEWIYVGIHKPLDAQEWIRIDNGSPVKSLPWVLYYPDDDFWNCAVIWPVDGDLTNWQCERNQKSVCEIRIGEDEIVDQTEVGTTDGAILEETTSEAITETLPIANLPSGYVIYPGDEAAYKLYTDEKTWSEARERCISDGGHLAAADTPKKRNHIQNIFPVVGDWVYVGIHKSVDAEEWVRADNGLPLTSLPWHLYTSGDNEYSCAAIWPATGELTNWMCTKLTKSLCEIRSGENENVNEVELQTTSTSTEEAMTETTTQTPAQITLPRGYFTIPGDNVAYKYYMDEKTWYEARDRCISDGGHLAIVDTLKKRNRIQKKLPEVSSWVHVGLHKPAGAQQWITIHNGLPVSSTSVLPWYHEPEEHDDDYCSGIWPKDGDLTEWPCTRSARSLCEIQISENGAVDETEHQTTDESTTEEVMAEKKNETLTIYTDDNVVYKLYTEKTTWYEARDQCISDGGHLANVDSLEKLNRIHNKLPGVSEWVHVGLHKPVNAQEWTSLDNGLPVTSISWFMYTEGNNNYNCGAIYPDESLLTNWPCIKILQSLCEIRSGENENVDEAELQTTSTSTEEAMTETTTQTPARITLPQGYSMNPGDNVAYKIYTDKKTWREARDRCISDGGYLAIVDTLEKRNHIRNKFSQAASWLYIGLHRPAGAQRWISSHNGLPVSSTSVLPWYHVPEEHDENYCSAIWTGDGDLTEWPCTRSAESLCEIPISDQSTTEEATTEATTQVSPGITLPEGYSTYPGDNVAYKLYTDGKTWFDARDQCISDGGRLATVDTPEKRNHIRNKFSEVSGWVYVGLHSPADTPHWISIDTGLPVTSIPWHSYTPGDDHNCVTIYPPDGDMTNWPCDHERKSLCEIRIGENEAVDETELQTTDGTATEEATTEATTRVTLPEGYSTYPGDNVAYKLYTDEKTWFDARDRCISDGGHLATVDMLEKRDHIRNSFPGVSEWVHVGLHHRAGTPHWVSIDTGLPVTSISWHAYTSGESNYDCAAIYPLDGDLTNWPCANLRKSLCEIRIGENKTVDETELQTIDGTATEEASTEATTRVTLPEGYSTYLDDNVAYKLYTDEKTWYEARDRCVSDGGHLATVNSLEKRNRIHNKLPGELKWVHVGLYKPAGAQHWISIDTGLPVTGISWYSYTNEDGDYNCGAIYPRDGDLTNWPCTRLRGSLCEIRIGENKTVEESENQTTDGTATKEATTDATTQTSPIANLPPEYSMNPGDNVAYKLYTDEKTWYEARDRCVSDGGHLATVNSLEKRNRIQNKLPELSKWVHVGLYKPAGAQHWISIDTGLPVTSISWYSYTDDDSDYNCATIYPRDGDLTNWPCMRLRASLCEIRIGENETELQTTHSSTTEDAISEATTRASSVPHLPPGYFITPGYGAAYKLYTDKKTWAEASDRCISDGGHLAIADTREKIDQIRNLILDKALWAFVGIYKPAGAQGWVRVDNGLSVPNRIWSAVYKEKNIWNCGVLPSFKGGLINWNCAFRENSLCEILIDEN